MIRLAGLPVARLLFLFAVLLMPALALAQQGAIRAEVLRVIDGDTIQVRIGNATETVRYIGINTPELHHPTRGVEPGGQTAAEANRRLVEGQSVLLEFDAQTRDRYLRLLAYVWVNGQLVNALLVQQGYAAVATYPPNIRYADHLRALDRQARETQQGLWADPVARASETMSMPDPGAKAAPATGSGASPATPGGRSSTSVSGSSPSSSPSGGSVGVHGYTRSDGTRVAPYTRRAPRH
jgi:micrococcal nuclease